MEEIEEFWGRKIRASWWAATASLFLIVASPLWLFWNWIGLEYFGGSYLSEIAGLRRDGILAFSFQYLPRASTKASQGYIAWLCFQATLYYFLPGPISTGQLTPAGHLLKYKTNGLSAWTMTHCLAFGAAYLGYLDLTIIADNWEGLLVASNVYGFVLPALCLVKGYVAPSYVGDCKYSGSLVADYFIGVELNPRLGELFDLKLFHNGRPGIIAWTLIDASYAAIQFRDHGYISNSMWIVLILHYTYVLDFFVNEDWYLRTIDMCHDHFGYYLGLGCMAAVPNIYTIQCQYLARYPVNLSHTQAAAILVLGMGGYAIFRSANHQKDIIRSSNGQCDIWGRQAQYMRCTYKTEDGRKHESLLLCSGWWGFSRHANYLGDLMQAFALGLACSSTQFLPWAYTFFLSAIMINRLPRDEARCRRKYGKDWRTYCAKVRWRLLPGVY
ncbi:MAG: hypothetical protein HETSPECPRED_003894 [Heterodermia speciosa]|uniref:7-dehydrocholesterol reductase n=1 Tax=Heterodermia speciosa TaxID=116794 RepID=A0A8H3IHI7_9LECA|nr:MAG: hypothetical protein HETSPECPRED_003894 [Heterodermia speciosa]